MLTNIFLTKFHKHIERKITKINSTSKTRVYVLWLYTKFEPHLPAGSHTLRDVTNLHGVKEIVVITAGGVGVELSASLLPLAVTGESVIASGECGTAFHVYCR